ncbi:MAG TPA: GAF domain-containing sensor histidine kinase [Thermomicrobiales bacterium]|nr:GAF domain-containing sensor histidine kinase [Thermomicrobiales bacterium]
MRAHSKLLPALAGATLIPWSLWLLVVGLFLLSAWYSLHQDGPIALSPSTVQDILYLAAVIGLPYASIGAFIAARQPWNAIGWTLWSIGAISATGQFIAAYCHSSHPLNIELAAVLTGANEIAWMLPIPLAIVLVPLLFPNGHPPGPRWRWLYAILTLALLSLLVASGLEGWRERDAIAAGATHLPDPSGVTMYVLLVALVAAVVATVGAFASLAFRYRSARANERDQLKWFFFGLLIVVVTIVLEMTVVPSSIERIVWFATLALPASMAIGILRYQLFDIDLIVSRTVLWSLLTAFVFGVYVIIVGVIGSRLTRVHDLALSLAATGIVAVCFQPVRVRLQSAIDHRLFGDRDDPYAAVARLGRQLERVANPQAMLGAIAESVANGLKLPYAAIALRDGDRYPIAATYGAIEPGEATLTLPLISSSEHVGELILAPRTPNDSFGPADLRLLEDLARQIGVAAHAAQLTTDLQRSREQLVIAREEERRRIRNDLHDGLGPVLSGLKLRAETARNLVGDNPPVDALLADIAERTETAVTDIRRLVYSLRPPALDDLGLSAALEELGYQADVPVSLTLPNPMPPLSAAVEVAVYRVTQEALTNIARHSGAHSALVTLRTGASTLSLSISDDGAGLPADIHGGVGLRSMRERVSELGGAIAVDSATDLGTTIRVELPLVQTSSMESSDVE